MKQGHLNTSFLVGPRQNGSKIYKYYNTNTIEN